MRRTWPAWRSNACRIVIRERTYGALGAFIAQKARLDPGRWWERWELYPAGDSDTLELASLALELPVAEVYADVLLVPAEPSVRKRQDLTP
jgi:hypothetical protein